MLNNALPSKRTRFAIYTRYSSEMQNDLSLEAQERLCREAVAQRDGAVVAVFSDGAKSGWSLERDGFVEMRRAAERGTFDAIMFWKFDRLARHHDHVVMIKMLLRHEYGVKLYCVEGFSEDENDSPYTAMMEQLLAVISAFYSKNLSSETKRGKKQRAINGEFNGSIAPLGYTLVLQSEATDERPAGLYINPRQAVIVRRAFHMYASGQYSDALIAEWMNQQTLIQDLRRGQMPIGKEMVRDMLQNRVYTGRVPYAETLYNGGLGQGKRSARKRKEWFEGKHQGFISDALLEECLKAREQLTAKRRSPQVMRTYVLHDRVYCARCVATKPHDLVDANYGKMRPGWNWKQQKSWYRCLARDRGYCKCEQGYVETTSIDEQVAFELAQLVIPSDFKQRVEEAIRSRTEHAEAVKRMEDIAAIVERIDFRWEKGFMTPDEYIEKRSQLQRELESLRPVDYDELMEAADLIAYFNHYWQQCAELDNPEEARQQLMAKIVDRVFVYDRQVIAIALHGDFGIVLDETTQIPQEVLEGLKTEMGVSNNSSYTQNGSDGSRIILKTAKKRRFCHKSSEDSALNRPIFIKNSLTSSEQR